MPQIDYPVTLCSLFVVGAGTSGHPLHGIYDNGGCSLDQNEALTASYLYPELYNVTSSRPRTQYGTLQFGRILKYRRFADIESFSTPDKFEYTNISYQKRN